MRRRMMVLAFLVSVAAMGCTPAERCAAARGASLACTFVNVAADEVCEGAAVMGGTAGGEGPPLTADERAAALESLDAARAAVLAAPEAPAP